MRFAASRLPQSFADLPDLLSVADVIMVADDAGLLRVIHNSWGECGTVDVPHLVFTATEVTDAIERSRDLPL